MLNGEGHALESDGNALKRQRKDDKGRRRSIERHCKVAEGASEALNGDGKALTLSLPAVKSPRVLGLNV